MPVAVSYTVHSVQETQVAVKAQLNGRTVDATVPGFVVELVDDDHGHTLRFVPSDDASTNEMRELFRPGAAVVATFSAGA